jgi:hypothetical protein
MGILDPIRTSRRKAKTFTVTVAPGKVTSDLSNFPVMLRMSSLPGPFWANVREDGGDIRVYTSAGVPVAIDLSRFDYWGKDGVLFFKAPALAAAASNGFKISCGVPRLKRLADTDPYGRNAVWADYVSVFLFGETQHDRTGKTNLASAAANPTQFWDVVETSPNLYAGDPVQQGPASDNRYIYVCGTNQINKYLRVSSSVWTLVASVDNPCGDSGLDVNHLGQPAVVGNRLYVPVAKFGAGVVTPGSERIFVYDTATLARVSIFDVSANSPGMSAIGFCDEDGLLYIASYNDGSVFKKFTTEGVYVGALALSVNMLQIQGLCWWDKRKCFVISTDVSRELHAISYAGTYDDAGAFGLWHTTLLNEMEGVGPYLDYMMFEGNADDSLTQQIVFLKAKDIPLGAGGGVTFTSTTSYMEADSRPSYTTFTLGLSFSVSDKTTSSQNRTALSYRNKAAGATARRTSPSYRFATSRLSVWDSWNATWLDSNIDPVLNQVYRMHAAYNDVANTRKLYVDGVLKGTTNSAVDPVADLDSLHIGRENETGSQPFRGDVGFVYLRSGELSAAWIAAEDLNLRTPGSFYTVTAG